MSHIAYVLSSMFLCVVPLVLGSAIAFLGQLRRHRRELREAEDRCRQFRAVLE